MNSYLILVDQADGSYSGRVFAVVVKAATEKEARAAVEAEDEENAVQSCEEITGEEYQQSTGRVIYG